MKIIKTVKKFLTSMQKGLALISRLICQYRVYRQYDQCIVLYFRFLQNL